jgi:hypothetical protein
MRVSRGFIIVACVALGLATAEAKYAMRATAEVPIERLLQNLEAARKKTPDDPELLLNLARVHAMAYATKGATAVVISGTDQLREDVQTGNHRLPWESVPPANAAAKEKAAVHLKEAIALHRRVLELDPKNDAGRIGLGWCLAERERGTRRARSCGSSPPMPGRETRRPSTGGSPPSSPRR